MQNISISKHLYFVNLVLAQNYLMKLSATVPWIRTAILSVIAALSILPAVNAQKPTLPSNPNQAQPIDPNDPNTLRPTGQNNSLLSIEGGKRLMNEASNAVGSQNYSCL
jgi:hypothetical protein